MCAPGRQFLWRQLREGAAKEMDFRFAGIRSKSCKESKMRDGKPSATKSLAARQFAHGFHFQVAPGAACLAGLVQPVKLGLNASSKLASS